MKTPFFYWLRPSLALLATVMFALALSGCSKQPMATYFARAVFGPNADDPVRVIHFIVQGSQIFVDADHDDLPSPDERLPASHLEPFTDDQTGTTYHVHEVRLGVEPGTVSPTLPQQICLNVQIDAGSSYEQVSSIVMTENRQAVNWKHFGGPLQILFDDSEMDELIGGSEVEVRVLVGTVAGDRPSNEENARDKTHEQGPFAVGSTFASLSGSTVSRLAFVLPRENFATPEIAIEFPTSGEPIIVQLMLDDFC